MPDAHRSRWPTFCASHTAFRNVRKWWRTTKDVISSVHFETSTKRQCPPCVPKLLQKGSSSVHIDDERVFLRLGASELLLNCLDVQAGRESLRCVTCHGGQLICHDGIRCVVWRQCSMVVSRVRSKTWNHVASAPSTHSTIRFLGVDSREIPNHYSHKDTPDTKQHRLRYLEYVYL